MDPDSNPSITPYPDGPYYVNDVTRFSNRHGAIRTNPTMTVVLCRCGASAIKPFCDGTHVKIGFSSAKLESSVEDRPDSAPAWSVEPPDDDAPQDTAAIFVAPDGPYVVTGGPELRSTILSEDALPTRFMLCRCGGSRNKPFCDGSHRRIGFKDDKN
jgi:CDGSH-type Zn-finger protein